MKSYIFACYDRNSMKDLTGEYLTDIRGDDSFDATKSLADILTSRGHTVRIGASGLTVFTETRGYSCVTLSEKVVN